MSSYRTSDYSAAEKIAGFLGDMTVLDIVYDAYPDLNAGMQTIISNSFAIDSDISIEEIGFGRYKQFYLNNYHVEPVCDYPEIFAELFEKAEEAARRRVNDIISSFNVSALF